MATFQATHNISIQEQFQKFHAANPRVFLLIVQEADKKIRNGQKKFSVKEIVNYLRWNKFFKTEEDTLFEIKGTMRRFKVNDIYISRYARLLITTYPHMTEYIEMRNIRSL